jgi:hypothetical protein
MPKAIENTCLGITRKQAESSGLDFDSLKKEEEALEPGARKVLEQEALIFEEGFNKGRRKDGNYIRNWLNFLFCLNRLFIATKTSNPASLSKAIGIKSASVYRPIKKHEIPDNWFIKVGKKFGVSIDWLTGHEISQSRNLEDKSGKVKEGTFDEMLKVIGEDNPKLHDKLVGEIVRNYNKLNKGLK